MNQLWLARLVRLEDGIARPRPLGLVMWEPNNTDICLFVLLFVGVVLFVRSVVLFFALTATRLEGGSPKY